MAKDKLYILHGWTYSTEKWEPFLTTLKKKNIQHIFLKVPGLTAELKEPWDINDYVQWLDQQLPEKKVILLGHSNGGRIALSYAHAYPNKVSQLFLLDSAGIIHNDVLSKSKRIIFKSLAKAGKKIANSERAKKILYRLAREEDYKNAPLAMKKTMENLIKVDILPVLKTIQIPTIIIWGKDDKVTPFSDALIFKNNLQNSNLFPIESARHSPMFTHVEEVAKIVSENIL